MKKKILSLGLVGLIGILGSVNVFANNTDVSKEEYKVKMEKSNVDDKTGGKTQEEWADWKINNCNSQISKEEYKVNMEKNNIDDKIGGKTQEEWAEWKINNCK